MGSYNIYYFKYEVDAYPAIKKRYVESKSSFNNRSIKYRYLTLGFKGFDPQFVRIQYLYDQAPEYPPYNSRIELRLENGYAYSHKDLHSLLLQKTKPLVEAGKLEWLPLGYSANSICRYREETIDGRENFFQAIKWMLSVFDPIFAEYTKRKKEEEQSLRYLEGISFDSKRSLAKKDIVYSIVRIKDLDFSLLTIPGYQRTYKWARKNVNQLINDILGIEKDSAYRLGTLVLHNGEIVDGQQRIVTLALILSQLFRDKDVNSLVKNDKEYLHLYKSVIGFWDGVKYKSKIAIENIEHNLDLIKSRQSELNLSFFKSLVDQCEFVVVKLKSQTEAFQFFDSQNSRGKDLSPHDLLKAFHLREIPQFSDHDKNNITYWQRIQTEDLEDLFLTLYRVKRWSKGLSAREFTKDDIQAFKGLSLKKGSSDHPELPLYGPVFYLYQLFLGKDPKDYPFQLDGEITNGSLFFDMVCHYNDIYESLYDISVLNGHPKTQQLLTLLDTYDKRNRIGDTYVRSLFDCLMVYYVDKFGYDDIDRASEQFFLCAYGIRLKNNKVSIATVDRAVLEGTMFSTIRDASSPIDVMNVEIERITADKDCSQALKEKFMSLNKLTNP